MIEAIIIDDEEKGRNNLAAMLKKHCPEVKLVTFANGVKQGVELINKLHPNLIFLDIEMTDGTGFDLLEQCANSHFEVIFVTAYNQYGLNAIKFSAIDYILKPIDEAVLVGAIAKARKQIELKQENIRLKNLLLNASLPNSNKRIALPFVDKIEFIEVEKIIRLAAEGSYTNFFTTGKKPLMVSKSLKEYDDILCSYGFIRTHQAHLVNPDYIQSFVKSDGGYLLMKNGDSVPISRLRKNDILSVIKGR